MCLMGVNFYKQIFECFCKLKNNSNSEIIEKRKKLIEKAKLAIEKHDREYQEVYSVVYEIRLFDFLRKKNVDVIFHTDKTAGPDLECDFGYVECISITKGSEENRIIYDKIMSGSVNRHKAGEVRITSAFIDKCKKYAQYISSNKLKKDKPRIISINTSILSNEVHHLLSEDLIKKLLYGIDTKVVCVNNKEKKVVDTFYSYNTTTEKNTTSFETGYFWKDEHKDISAVILNHNAFTEDIDDSYFVIYLNPNATIPVDTQKIQKFKYFYLKSKTDSEMVFEEHNPIKGENK